MSLCAGICCTGRRPDSTAREVLRLDAPGRDVIGLDDENIGSALRRRNHLRWPGHAPDYSPPPVYRSATQNHMSPIK